MENQSFKLSFWQKVGFGIGGLADNYLSVLVASFLMFFLITAVGMNPALAGSISMLSVLWDAVTDPIIGAMSDRSKAKAGRRRPFMLLGGIAVCVLAVLTFTVVEGSATFQFIYYLVVACLFWTAFTVWSVPYLALGAEVTTDYEERNNLRGFIGFFSLIGVFFATSLSMLVVGILSDVADAETAWQVVGLACGILSFLSILVTYFSTKGKEPPYNPDSNLTPKENVWKSFFGMLKIDSMRKLIYLQFAYALGNGIIMTNTMFILTAKMGITEQNSASYYAFTLIVGLILTPIIVVVANKIGKKNAYAALMFLAAAVFVVLYFTDITTLIAVGFYGTAVALEQGTYQTISMSMVLDNCTLLDYRSGERNEALCSSMISLAMKAGSGVAGQIVGIMLVMYGYNEMLEVQTAETMSGIVLMSTIIAPIFFAITVAIVWYYKLDSRKFDLLKEAIDKRNRGEADYRSAELDNL